MLTIGNGASRAVILLHEIYGVNAYAALLCKRFADRGYDVYCPDLLGGKVYEYGRQQAAYRNFMQTVGLEAYRQILPMLFSLRPKYRQLLLFGSSVGATLAWRAAAAGPCDGLIACYGSRIRDYLSERPQCPSLLLFAEKEAGFNPRQLIEQIKSAGCKNLKAHLLEGEHGFLDPYGPCFYEASAQICEHLIDHFLAELT